MFTLQFLSETPLNMLVNLFSIPLCLSLFLCQSDSPYLITSDTATVGTGKNLETVAPTQAADGPCTMTKTLADPMTETTNHIRTRNKVTTNAQTCLKAATFNCHGLKTSINFTPVWTIIFFLEYV